MQLVKPTKSRNPARTGLFAALPNNSGGQRRVSTLQTRFWRVEWQVFSFKTVATQPAWPPLQMKASFVQIRWWLAIFHLHRQQFCLDLLRYDHFGSDLAIFFKKSLKSVTCKLLSVTFRSPPTKSDDGSFSFACRCSSSVSTESIDHFLESDLTQPVVIGSQLRVWFSPT